VAAGLAGTPLIVGIAPIAGRIAIGNWSNARRANS
jgi:hypothetical protein